MFQKISQLHVSAPKCQIHDLCSVWGDKDHVNALNCHNLVKMCKIINRHCHTSPASGLITRKLLSKTDTKTLKIIINVACNICCIINNDKTGFDFAR